VRLALVVLLLPACSLRHVAHQGTSAALLAPDACDRLDRSVMGWTAATMALGVLGGSTGVTAALTEDVPRYVTGGISVGLSTTAAIATYLSTAYAQRYVRGCTLAAGGVRDAEGR
jgi:hypothetical protein